MRNLNVKNFMRQVWYIIGKAVLLISVSGMAELEMQKAVRNK